MPKRNQSKLDIEDKILGALVGAVIGAGWAFLKGWQTSIRSFSAVGGKGFALFGLLLGWFPGLFCALAGMVYGAFKGGQLGVVEGFKAIIQALDCFAKKSEVRSSLYRKGTPPLHWQRMEMLPQPKASSLKSILKRTGSKKEGEHNRIRFKAKQNETRQFDLHQASIHMTPSEPILKRGRSRQKQTKAAAAHAN